MNNRDELQAQLAKAEAEVERLRAELSKPIKGPLGGDVVRLYDCSVGQRIYIAADVIDTSDYFRKKGMFALRIVNPFNDGERRLELFERCPVETNVPLGGLGWSTVRELAKIDGAVIVEVLYEHPDKIAKLTGRASDLTKWYDPDAKARLIEKFDNAQ